MKKHDVAINITLMVIAVITVSLALSGFIPMSATAREKIKEYEILEKMIEIDNISHQRDDTLGTLGSGYNPERDKLFHIIDNKYHITQYKNEKFKASQELYKLVKKQAAFLEQMGKVDAEQKKIFEQLQKEIDQIQ